MTRAFAARLLTAAALVAAPAADQTPRDNSCRSMPHQVFIHGSGVDPSLPSGLAPGNEPVT